MQAFTLTRHELEFTRARPYFLDHIGSPNALAKTIHERLEFKEGRFFTLLPEDAFLEKLYSFDTGWIIPQTAPIVNNFLGSSPKRILSEFA